MQVFTLEEYGALNEAVTAAFEFCRSENCPQIVMIDSHKCKLFPSGRLVDLDTGKINDDTDW